MNERIYVSVASYRDPQLKPTLKNLIKTADNPDNLRICVAWQHSREDVWDELDAYKDDKRFDILDLDASQSRGVCWARQMVQRHWHNEGYYFQIDSHMRFMKGWDTKLKNMIKMLQEDGHEKPILTTYVPSFDAESGEKKMENWKMIFDRFTPEGVVFHRPEPFTSSNPIRFLPTQFFSAHFMFTIGKWAKEVQYDPNIYFHGEEITLAVRSYTHGYDSFVPYQNMAWHEYTRKGRRRVWDDDKEWVQKNEKSLKLVRAVLGVDGKGELPEGAIYRWNMGTARTKEDYEKFAGIRFKDRAVQQYTLNHLDPPNPQYASGEWYEKSWRRPFRHCLNVPLIRVMGIGIEFSHFAVIFEDEKGEPIHRQDAGPEEIANNYNGAYIHIWREYEMTDNKPFPHHAVVWPYNKIGEWGEKIVIPIGY
jgi:hypothetical protein